MTDNIKDNADNDDNESGNAEKREKKHDSGAADLEKVTNYAEEKEIKSDANMLSVINDVKRKEATEKVGIITVMLGPAFTYLSASIWKFPIRNRGLYLLSNWCFPDLN